MRARHMVFLVTALAAAACGDNSAPMQDRAESITLEQRSTRASDASANMIPAPAPVSPPSRNAGFAGGVAGGVPRAAPPPPPSEAPLQDPAQPIAPSMLIRTGDARIKVESVDTAVVRLQELVRRVGGYVANSSAQAGENEVRQATLELKIPSARFADVEVGLNTLGKVEYVNVNTQDVGEEFVDVTARVENARRLEQRLIQLLATRTGKLEEVLSVERELARVRETIERYEGRLRYLRTRVDISSLTVTVHESEPLVGERGTGNRIVEAFKDAWRNFVGFIAGLIEAMGILLPVGIIGFLVARWVWRNKPNRTKPEDRSPFE